MNLRAGSAHALWYAAYVSLISLQWRSTVLAGNRSGIASVPPHAATRYRTRACAPKSVPVVEAGFFVSARAAVPNARIAVATARSLMDAPVGSWVPERFGFRAGALRIA